MPNSEDIVVIPGVGHMLQVEKPQPVADAMAAFLRKHPIDRRAGGLAGRAAAGSAAR